MMSAVAAEHAPQSGSGSGLAAASVPDPDASEQPSTRRPQVRSVLDFDSFYTDHRDEIGRALAFTLGDQMLGAEAVDEAMARAYQRWDKVKHYDRPAGWVYRTGLNWGRSSVRSMLRRRRREQLVASDAPQVADALSGARPELMAALGQLSIGHRAVVVLRYYCDWSVADTAVALEIAEGTVQSRSARALDELRRVLGEDDREGASS